MQKGITQVFLSVLLLMIGISLTSLVYLFATGAIYNIFPSESFNASYQRTRACISLENVDFYNANLTLKNCGLVPLTKFRLFIDLTEIPLSISKLEPQESATIHYARYLEGMHNFIVFTDYAETPLMELNASTGEGYIYSNIILLIDSYPKYVSADNVSKSVITVRAIDRNNRPLANRIIQFSTSLGYLDIPSNTTDENGYTQNGIKSDKEGLANINAKLDFVLNTTTVIFIVNENEDPWLGDRCLACGEPTPKGCNSPLCPPHFMLYIRKCPIGYEFCPTQLCLPDPLC
jgi:hypothetical protein